MSVEHCSVRTNALEGDTLVIFLESIQRLVVFALVPVVPGIQGIHVAGKGANLWDFASFRASFCAHLHSLYGAPSQKIHAQEFSIQDVRGPRRTVKITIGNDKSGLTDGATFIKRVRNPHVVCEITRRDWDFIGFGFFYGFEISANPYVGNRHGCLTRKHGAR